MSTLADKSRELMRNFQPNSVEGVQGLVVTFYIGKCEDNPIDFSYVAPVSWERRVEAKDSFERILKRLNRIVIGSVILGLNADEIPKTNDAAVEKIYSMVPQNVPLKMLNRVIKAQKIH